MVKPSATEKSAAERSDSSSRYKGVRKRKWGKWVSEIRMPNSRERIWLGSFDTPEKAGMAFDAALFCLRGRNAKFNFPDNPPQIPGGQSLSPPQIQAAAARFANEQHLHQQPQDPHPLLSDYASTSDDAAATESDVSIDWSSFDLLTTMGSCEGLVSDFAGFSGIQDFSAQYFPPPPQSNASTGTHTAGTFNAVNDDHDEGAVENGYGPHHVYSFLWNF